MTTESYQHKAPPAGLAGTVDHLDAGHGWTLVRLMTKQAFVREGAHMDHCLGDATHYHLAGEEELTGDAIWSLRDRDGVSWATLEILEGYRDDLSEPRLSNVVMAKGPGNRLVKRSVARRLQPLVLAFRAAGRELDFSGETELVVADDGRVMRQDRAPADVIEQSRARHVARVVKLQKPQGEGWRGAMQRARDEWSDLLTPDAPAREQPARPWYARIPPRAREIDLLAITAGLPNPVVEVALRDPSPNGVRGEARLRDGEVVELIAEGNWHGNEDGIRRALYACLYERVLALQPPSTASMGNPRRGDIFSLSDEPISDVVVTVAGEALREGDEYGVDAALGAIEFKRDVDGQVEIAYRITFDPNRRVLTLGMDTQAGSIPRAIPWSLEPLTSERVTVEDAAHAQDMAEALRGGARGFPGGGGGRAIPQSPRYRLVQTCQAGRWCSGSARSARPPAPSPPGTAPPSRWHRRPAPWSPRAPCPPP